jgi:Flp pilus assembly protein TadG
MRRLVSLSRFARDESGSLSMEAVLMVPLLLWVILGTLVYFQAFHAQSLNVKVTYTIGDILSREDAPITPEYVDSMYALQGAMTGSSEPRKLRITAVTYRASDKTYRMVWSQVRGTGVTAHTNSSLAQIANASLPVMADGQVTILTETWLDHTPLFTNWMGLIRPRTFYEIMPTRPRAPQFCWNSSDNPATWTQANTICNA